jgi:hypothetical protein
LTPSERERRGLLAGRIFSDDYRGDYQAASNFGYLAKVAEAPALKISAIFL